MIGLFRKIRQKLLTEGRLRQYAAYAVGEILLVMIGILLALQVNNWNENRKERIVEEEAYNHLLSSLTKDSSEVVRILNYLNISLENQLLLIKNDPNHLLDSLGKEGVNQILFHIYNGSYSFFPKLGAYNSIISNSGSQVLRSGEIKSRLIELYDYKYKRYENIDAVADHKFQYDLHPFLHRNIGFYISQDEILIPLNASLLEENYSELVNRCLDVYDITLDARNLLLDIQTDIQELSLLIDGEVSN